MYSFVYIAALLMLMLSLSQFVVL